MNRDKGEPTIGHVKMGGDARNTFKFDNASLLLLVHFNLSFFFSMAKKQKTLSPA